ncbi:MAG: LysM peptidoglycan-binding domain-containing M23 family metallopeptidase, partial [Aquificota bacterium]|nr:LysM peptidoglycan-binding domain-containing M23 family metallopeptidase [Aquificota bacterium]
KCRTYYRVKPGDSLWKIAERYNLYIKDILRANPKLKGKKYLRAGQRICIPYRKKHRAKGYIIYRVRRGDTLEKIGKRFGVSWREIKRINNLKDTTIRVGQKLKIPKKGYVKRKRHIRRTHRDVIYITYRVRRGDTLEKIGRKFGVSWKSIKRANGLRSDIIRVGQKLKIPVPRTAFERRYMKKHRIRIAFLPVEGRYRKSSKGLDIYAPCGEAVRVVDDGRVIYSGDDLAIYGNMIIVEHRHYLSIYAYNMKNLVERGERVSRGEVIGKVGVKPGTGRCALHFELRAKDGSVLNPLEYLVKK